MMKANNKYKSQASYLIRNISNYVTIVSLAVALILGFVPNLFNVEYSNLSEDQYKNYNSKFDDNAKKFIENNLQKKFQNPNDFYKIIPSEISGEQKNLILDIFKAHYSFQGVQYITFTFLFFFLLLAFLYREISGGRKYRVAHSQKYLHQAIHQVRDDWHKIFYLSEAIDIRDYQSLFKSTLRRSLNNLSKFFSVVTGTPCFASIQICKKGGNYKHFVVCDDATQILDIDIIRPIKDNSDLHGLAVGCQSFYCVRNVNKDSAFVNSKITAKEAEQVKSKRLKYVCAAVWPIRYAVTKPNIDEKHYEMIGILKIYSNTSNAFYERYDFESGAIIADFYAIALRKYLEGVIELKKKIQKIN